MPHSPDRRSVLAGLATLPVLAAAPLMAEPIQRPFNMRIVMSGHSLSEPIPRPLEMMVKAVAGPQSLGMVIDNSAVPGSPMEIRWNGDDKMTIAARRDIGNYDLLVLTERVTVLATIVHHKSMEMALNFVSNAWKEGNGGKGAETILYASWITLESGPDNEVYGRDTDEGLLPFRERLDVELGHWEDIASYVNSRLPTGCPEMKIIPGPKVMAAIYDEIAAGRAPGLERIEDIFEDVIHVNPKGVFLIALAHYAVIYGRDPREIPVLRGEVGWPTAEQQEWMKALVWDVVRAYPHSGLA